jgi:hypothetical protein
VRNAARLLSAAVLVLGLSLCCAAQQGKIEKLGTLADSSVSETVRQTLDSTGYRVLLDDGSPICELWIRRDIPTQAKKDSEDLLYSELAESTLVGVLHFAKLGSDFRGQTIPAGFYTLRYELIPDDGNHLGVAPNRDFLLLIPAVSDADPKKKFTFEELVELSRKATGTRHPGPLSLVQASNLGTAPSVSKDDQDHWILSGSMKLASGNELPFGLVVKGTAQQ